MQQPQEQIDQAPVVLLGVIVADTMMGKPVPSRRNGGYPMILSKLQVRVENVLLGSLAYGTHSVYYFHLGGAIDGPRPLGQWEGAKRRIFWLRQDSGVLRTACDGYDSCTLGVRSGSHPQYRADKQKPVEYAVADILLTRGEGAIDDEFACELGYYVRAPKSYLFERLQSLAATEVPVVRNAACTLLAAYRQACVASGTKPSSR
jgi:hypothetical protein